MPAIVFPGQGAQYSGMGKELYESNPGVRHLFDSATDVLGFVIKDVMFGGTAEELKQTSITQPAIYIHSVAVFQSAGIRPDAVAGHSLGEISALTAAGYIDYKNGLALVAERADAMQKACELESSTMAAILALADEDVERVCQETEGVVVAANYNCPGQVVISGNTEAVNTACEKAKEAGAKRALVLPVSGAFHSPLMMPAQQQLATAIEGTTFTHTGIPIYQNVDAQKHTDPDTIKRNLLRQLTGAVRWSQSVQNMVADGIEEFVEMGPGNVLQGLIKKTHRPAHVSGMQ